LSLRKTIMKKAALIAIEMTTEISVCLRKKSAGLDHASAQL
jgi:hypothetical protein